MSDPSSSSASRRSGRDEPGGETSPPAGAGPGYPLLLFRAGAFRGGVPVARVREVVRLRRLARIPDGRQPFRGLLSVRGDIVTVLDLAGLQEMAAGRSGLPTEDTTGPTTGKIRPTRIDSVIVLRGGPDALGLEVDGVEDIHDFSPRPGEAPPPPASPGESAAAPTLPEPPPPTESTGPAAAPEATRLWAAMVRGPQGEVGVLNVDAVFDMAVGLAGTGEGSELLEVGDRG